ncbi:hypothetical protein GJW-30_1_00437 [Variibacter gotjawalensis]|uniref:YARHG domain-containing protein n=1 Tax=Variibacter gotjawalensis TaxID=1333996 RepID=A0A0S3PPP7_9BRAD|nr:hypothetical protein [Variibacter gotjawalensis]NIK48224.1 hypothetical protein [Variibacter gotjawalensis]RZS50096.1 hypothetical protein EV661_2547 [Variibacter gotjawalensis]BAT57926.1 hypothetical protein GJW-30_1_00437 [Variibacter gotjawalensis]
MTRIAKLLTAATIGAGALMIAAPASAQVEIGVPGVGVRLGGPAYYYDTPRSTYYYDTEYRTRTYPARSYWNQPERVYYNDNSDCSYRVVERVRPDGTVVTMRERDCD